MQQSTALLATLAACLLTAALAEASPARGRPVPVGTFIQWYLVRDWSDAQWQAEFRAMREVGMRYLVFAPTADEGKERLTVYPTRMPGWRQREGCPDLVEACLRNAKKAGIRVFLGLNFADAWWRKAGSDRGWLLSRMDDGSAVAGELYHGYHARYPDTLYGWYWVWEVDNLNFRRPAQQEALTAALDRSVSHLKKLDPRMPVMLCPFMNAACGPPEEYAALWKAVFAGSALGRGDIFCPQDCVGAGGLKLDQVPAWFAALKGAVDTKPGLRFWSDAETFSQEDWTSAPLDRFTAQLRAVQPYVEQIITFAYSHYYSPVTCAPGFQRAYREYVRTGRLDATPPPPPSGVRVERLPGGEVSVRWEPPADQRDVCGYVVLRDGARIARKQTAVRIGAAPAETSVVDKGAAAGGAHEYAVRSYDFAGNLSPMVDASLP